MARLVVCCMTCTTSKVESKSPTKMRLKKKGPQQMKATTMTKAEILAVLNSSLYWKNW